MKKISSILLLSIVTVSLHAQLAITNNQTAMQLANQIVATSGTLGVTVSNATMICDSSANGLFTGNSNIGFNNGIVLGTGIVATDIASSNYGINGIPSDFASQSTSQSGDSDLDLLVTAATYDACVLEFDLQPVGNYVEFEYVFGSEEYPEFNCSSFNDVFAFYISGPGFATPQNIALIPTTTIPVSINSINDGSGGNCSTNTNLYVTNNDTITTMDGFTVPLIATAAVTPLQTYHLKLAIADAGDMILNSYVLLKANSLKSGNTNATTLNDLNGDNGLSIYPTSIDQSFSIINTTGQGWTIQLINLEGEIVFRSEINATAGNSSMQIGTLPKGLYIVKMINTKTGDIQTTKIVKE